MAKKSMTRRCADCDTMIEAPYAKYCDVCRPKHRRKKTTYPITEAVEAILRERYDSNIRGRRQEIADVLGWPAPAVGRAARQLGLSRPWPKDRREWTADEVAFVRRWAGKRSPKWMAHRMERGPTSIVLKIRRLGLSRRVRDGYSAHDLAPLFGVDPKTVIRWIRLGWLAAKRRGTAHPNDAYSVDQSDLLPFIRAHRGEIDLRKVDQDWFLDIVLGQQCEPGDHCGEMYLPTPAEIARDAAAIRRRKYRSQTEVST